MTHRERVLMSLKRQIPDRVPIDLGGTLASTINIHAYRRLMAHLGFGQDPPISFMARRSNSVMPDERLLQYLQADCRALVLGSPDVNPERELPDGSLRDEWHVTWRHLGEERHYINTDGPFYNREPDPMLIDSFPWPDPLDPGRFRHLRSQAESLRAASSAAVILVLGVGPIHQFQFMRGYAAALEDTIAAPNFVQAFLDRYMDYWLRLSERALQEVGDVADLAMFGDDLGTQQGPVMNPALYRRLFKPHHARVVQMVKRFNKPIVLHSCGSVAAFIPDIIEVGCDALNPIQVSAKGMGTARLKREFGKDITFWGAIDTQTVLPRGSASNVREEVRRRIADLAPGGGYVAAAVHNIQAEVPAENILAMFESARELGRY